ncbi:MAG: hypothetical protein ACI915_004758 [Gammaproteobacteria bacterium]|jgi:hypothetical protein
MILFGYVDQVFTFPEILLAETVCKIREVVASSRTGTQMRDKHSRMLCRDTSSLNVVWLVVEPWPSIMVFGKGGPLKV